MSGSTFSYAQAAKGQSASQPDNTQTTSSQNQEATSTTSIQSKENAPATSASVVSGALSTTSNDLDSNAGTRNTSVQPDHATSDLPNGDTTSSVKATPKDGIDSSSPAVERPVGDAASQASTGPRQQDEDVKKSKKTKKGKSAEKDAEQNLTQEKKEEEVAPKVELSEAPIPTVNIWKQRMGEQAAKSKPASSANPQARSSGPSSAQRPKDEGDVVATQAKTHVGKGSKKIVESAQVTDEPSPRRNGPRGSRAAHNDDPPAANAASWPTPDTAATESKSVSQTDKSEDKEESLPNKPRQKEKWVHVPFVPTAVFQTPIPSRGGPRAGRPAGRSGGREAPPRNHHNSTSASRRPGDGENTSRGASEMPQTSKRTSADATTERELRKTTVAADSSKASTDPSMTGAKTGSAKSGQQGPVGRSMSSDTSARLTTDDAASKPAERTNKENVSQVAREGHHHSNSGYRGSERARGGGRGRGNHSANGSHSQQASFGHGGPSYSFSSNASTRQSNYASNGFNQASYGNHFGGSTGNPNGRGRPNSMSFNNRGASQQGSSRHQNPRMPSMAPPVNFSYDQTMYPAAPLPFNYFESGLMGLVLTQLEYYFSIDNLCKDWFMRKHMDSQGFVFLSFIAQFKRMRELTTDYEIIRSACQESKDIDFVIGDDNQERVRRQGAWQNFILPMSERDTSAQNDGPVKPFRPPRSQYPQFPPQMMHGVYAPHQSPPMFSPNGHDHGFAPYMNGPPMGQALSNGMNGQGHPAESQLSATVPEFAPSFEANNMAAAKATAGQLNGAYNTADAAPTNGGAGTGFSEKH